jgi:flagellar motor switch protein FliG
MSLPATLSQTGLMRSAALMRALGAKANAAWASLSPGEAKRLSSAMQQLPDNPVQEIGAASAYTRAISNQTEHAVSANGSGSIWTLLSARDGHANAALIQNESPQVIAVILSRLDPRAAAETVRALPRTLATDALQRILNLADIRPAALSAIETSLTDQIKTLGTSKTKTGHEQVARIFDGLGGRVEQDLLSALDKTSPGTSEKIRALMFTFDDLCALDPASMQTVLASTDRAVLIVALKDAKPETADAFFKNMTQRAGELLRSEIESSGPVRRSEIQTAQAEIVALARTMVKRGDIMSADEDDELVE